MVYNPILRAPFYNSKDNKNIRTPWYYYNFIEEIPRLLGFK